MLLPGTLLRWAVVLKNFDIFGGFFCYFNTNSNKQPVYYIKKSISFTSIPLPSNKIQRGSVP